MNTVWIQTAQATVTKPGSILRGLETRRNWQRVHLDRAGTECATGGVQLHRRRFHEQERPGNGGAHRELQSMGKPRGGRHAARLGPGAAAPPLSIKRIYDGTAWGEPESRSGQAKAQYSYDGFRGEAAVNLTDDVFYGMVAKTSRTLFRTRTLATRTPPITRTPSSSGHLHPDLRDSGREPRCTEVAEAGDFAYTGGSADGVCTSAIEEDGGEDDL